MTAVAQTAPAVHVVLQQQPELPSLFGPKGVQDVHCNHSMGKYVRGWVMPTFPTTCCTNGHRHVDNCVVATSVTICDSQCCP